MKFFKLGLALAGLNFSGSLVAADEINLISGPFGTGSYVLGNAVEQIMQRHNDAIQVTSSETPGIVYNVKFLNQDPASKEDTFLAFSTGIGYLASQGTAPFNEPLPEPQLIANYLLGSVWLATFDPDIQSAADLEGKTIALGRPPQILWSIEPMHIITHGWDMEDDITIERLGTKDAAQALLNGSVDAAIVGGYADPISREFMPSPQTVELLAAGRTLYHIPWGEDAVQSVINKGFAMNHMTVPAGALEGLSEDLSGFFDTIAWMAYPEFSEEAAYEITRTLIKNLGEFAEFHALGKLMSADSMTFGWAPENIHPGALRAYREVGLIKE